MFEEFHLSQRKLQRSSIFKSTLDDIQHFEIMFQLENQMWGVEECSDLFWERRWNISEKFWIETNWKHGLQAAIVNESLYEDVFNKCAFK